MKIQSITFRQEDSTTDYTAVEVHRYCEDHFEKYNAYKKDSQSYSIYLPVIKYNNSYFAFTHFADEKECDNAVSALKEMFRGEIDVYSMKISNKQ
jgi:hypothetical protein